MTPRGAHSHSTYSHTLCWCYNPLDHDGVHTQTIKAPKVARDGWAHHIEVNHHEKTRGAEHQTHKA